MGRRKLKKLIMLLLMLPLIFCVFVMLGHGNIEGADVKPEVHQSNDTPQKVAAQVTPNATTSNTPARQDAMQIYARRRQRSDDVCFLSQAGEVYRMADHSVTRTAYCVTPKVGCTYWLSIFRWLHKDTLGKNYTSPFDMPRYQVHYKPHHMKYYSFTSTSSASSVPSFLSDRFRFMFVREPYARLWSAYVDKFLLPDYWNVDGVKITANRRGASRQARECGHDVTFAEFVQFVTSTPVSKLNDHYRPYQFLCDPCLFRPHVIGKMETFDRDSKYILDRMNLTGLDSQLSNSDQRARHEMDMLIDDAFHEIISYPFFINCTNSTDLAARLWKAFQINGHLPLSVEFPWTGRPEVDRNQLKDLVMSTFAERRPKSRAIWSHQKEQAMMDAYSQLSDTAMRRLRALYQLDFAMFDYDPWLEILYRKRRKG